MLEESFTESGFSSSVLQQPLGKLEARFNKRLPKNEMREFAELHTLLCKALDSIAALGLSQMRSLFKGSSQLTLLAFTAVGQ